MFNFTVYIFFFSASFYSISLSVDNPLSTTSYVQWELDMARAPQFLQQNAQTKNIDLVIQPGSSLSKMIRIPFSLNRNKIDYNGLKDVLKQSIRITAVSGLWKNKAYLNGRHIMFGDLKLNGDANNLPVFKMIISNIRKFNLNGCLYLFLQ